MHNNIVIRLIDGALAWYAPGSGGAPRFLDEEGARLDLQASLSQPGVVACFAAPSADVRLCQLKISPEEKKHIDKSLPFMLEEEIIADVDRLHFVSQLQGKADLMVAICAAEKMHQWRDVLENFTGIALWTPEQLLLPWRNGEWCLVIEENQALVRTGLFSGFGIELSLLSVILEAALEDCENAPSTIVIYGQDQEADSAVIPELVRGGVQWRRGDFSSALRLAQPVANSLNLLQADFALRLPLERWWKQWRLVAAMFAVAFGVQLAATYADLVSLQQEDTALRQSIESSYRRAYPKGAIVDAEKQLNRQISALRGSGQASGFISLVNRVGTVIASKPGAGIVSINYNDKGDELRMNITVKDFQAVEDIRTAMNKAGLTAIMESSNAQGDLVRARMRIANTSKGGRS